MSEYKEITIKIGNDYPKVLPEGTQILIKNGEPYWSDFCYLGEKVAGQTIPDESDDEESEWYYWENVTIRILK